MSPAIESKSNVIFRPICPPMRNWIGEGKWKALNKDAPTIPLVSAAKRVMDRSDYNCMYQSKIKDWQISHWREGEDGRNSPVKEQGKKTNQEAFGH